MIKAIEFDGRKYYIDSRGIVYNSRMRELKQQTWHTGYKYVFVGGHNRTIHRLVAMAFIPGYSEDLQVHHINKDRADNRLENLQMMESHAHQKLHNQIYPLTKTCEVCGREFTPHPTKRQRAHVCSEACKVVLDRMHARERQRPVIQYDLLGVKIRTWESARVIQRECGYFESNINKCCNHKIKTYKGFRWEYA